MKSTWEYEAEAAEAVRKYNVRRSAALRRLKQRIANTVQFPLPTSGVLRRRINAAIDAWAAKEFRV